MSNTPDKNNKEQELNASAIEFQPDALEIKQSKLPLLARFTPAAAFLLIAGVITWASVFKVDTVVQAPGKLVSDQNIVLKPRETAVIKSIEVKVGQIVKPNQILMTFDPKIYEAETERLRKELSTLTAQFERLQAEFKREEYKPSVMNEDAIRQMAIFKQRSGYYNARMNNFKEELNRIDASIQARKDSLANTDKRIKEFQQIEQMFVDLKKGGASTKREGIEIAIKRMEMETQADELRNNLVELNHQRLASEASKASFLEEWLNGITSELVKIHRELIATKTSFEKTRIMQEYICLRSPCEAVVHEMAPFSIGSAVREAEASLTLVPLDGIIELEAEISPLDIGKIKKDSEVRVKLNAYPFQKHGTLDGVVRYISEDTFNRSQGEMRQPGAAATYYRAYISISGKLRNIDEKFRLIPGMEAQAEIKVGKRRIIEYILYPLIKALDESAREP